MKEFNWYSREKAQFCRAFAREHPLHAHIDIRSPQANETVFGCDGPRLSLRFHDLEPLKIRKTAAFNNEPDIGEIMIRECFREDQAREIARFVRGTDVPFFFVNCEAGISRSAGVVLALRKFFGGSTEEVHQKAHPNPHVSDLLYQVLLEGE